MGTLSGRYNSNNLVTISPMENSCTACATKFYEFTPANREVITEISELFCEMFDIDFDRMIDQIKLSQTSIPQLPFCPNCLLELNEVRQMNKQLEKLNDSISKLKDSLLVTIVDNIKNYASSKHGRTALDSKSDQTVLNIRFLHEHIKKRCRFKVTSENCFNQSASASSNSSMPSVLATQDGDESEDIPDGYPLFVDLVESETNNSITPRIKIENAEMFDPLSSDNNVEASDLYEEDESIIKANMEDQEDDKMFRSLPPLVFSGVSVSRLQPHSKTQTTNRIRQQVFARDCGDNGEIGLSIKDDDLQEDCKLNQDEDEDSIISEELSVLQRTSNFHGPSSSQSIRQNPPPLLLRGYMGNSNLSRRSHESEIDFDDHDQRAHIRENFTMCPICFKYTLREGVDAEEHNCEQRSQTAHFQCGYCNLISQTEKSLHTHMKQHLDIANQQRLRVSNSGHTKLLEVFAAAAGPYPCPYCDSVFNRKSELMRGHIVAQHGIRLKPFPCSVCDSAFRSKNDLERHVRTHTGERPFTCTYCDKTFTRKHHLKTHTATHQRRFILQRTFSLGT